ncbi:MAG: M56 family metallopeptidase [Proteiniphilum sp.]|nr:M56 family metallopeptidase [Proteiniphilum sp.]
MESLLYYLLRASISMALLYGFYKLFLGKNTFHAINRFVLIAIALLTVLLPLCRFNFIPDLGRVTISDHSSWDLSDIPVSEFSSMTATQQLFPWRELLFVVFVVGFLIALVRYLIGFFQIIGIIRNSHKEKMNDGSTLCLSVKDIAPFSWMNYVVLHGKGVPEENRTIIQHEQAHIHLKHSFDMLFIDLFTSFFWFNPFSWLLRREIRSVHEYQADAQVLNEGVEIKQYQLLLIRKCVGEQKFALANNFLQRDLHKRIQMMMKKSSERQMKWRYTAALPLLFLVMVVLSVPKLNASIPDKAIEQSHEKAVKEGESIILSEDFAEFSNGSLELGKVRIVAKDDSIAVAAKVGAQPLYIVDGKEVASLSEFDPEQIESIEVLKQHATDKFGERGKEGVIHITTKKVVKKTIGFNEDDKPLLILDGEMQDAAFDLNSVSPGEIESMEVIKGKRATELFGDEGKNGVVVITRKKTN